MNIHIIGICGKGTSATALYLQEKGHTITGSDAGSYEPVTGNLLHAGIKFNTTYQASNIPDNVDMIIMGSSATLVPEKNEEVKKALTLGIPIKSFAEVLGEEIGDTHSIVIAGSYGKSTTTALTSFILVNAKKDPSYFIGAVVNDIPCAHAGTGSYFVLEGDEYPHDNTSRIPKFAFYHAQSVLLTSGEHDHINKFPTLSDYHTPYIQLFKNLPHDSLVVGCSDNPHVEELMEHSNSKKIFYSLDNKNVWHAEHISYGLETSFDIYSGDLCIGNFKTKLLGEYNIQNIVGVVALLSTLEAVTLKELQDGVKKFNGVPQRLELKTSLPIPIYENYGSSYTKARTGLEALKLHFPNKNIIHIFEPHTFSWRNREALSWYENVFKGSNTIIIYKPPTHGINSHDQLTLDEIYEKVNDSYPESLHYACESIEKILKLLPTIVNNNSIVLLTTSGNFDDGTEKIITLLKNSF